MSASTTKLLFNLLLICVVLDVVTRYFEKPPIRRTSQKNNPSKENKYENPLKDVDIDTSLDEDDDDFSDTKKKKPKKSKVNETEEDEEEKEKEKIKEKKSKKKKKKKSEDDEEEEERNVITIIYDKKSYQKYYDNLKNQILGNFTNFDVEEKEYPLPPNKKFFSKITFFTQIGVSLFILSGQKLKDKLAMIPASVFDVVEKNKWAAMIGNFFLHQWLNRYMSTTGAFEVYFKDRIIFSKLSSNRLPSEIDIHKIVKKYNKKKNKRTKKEEDDFDDDDDL